MLDRADFYAPLQYSGWLLWAGLAVLALLAAWYVFVFASTRKPAAPAVTRLFTPPSDVHSLKSVYLQRIDEIAADADAGRLPARASHQELSLLVRKSVRDATGVDAPRMTLAELHSHPLPTVTDAISRMYPAEFGVEPQQSVAVSAETARQVVSSWN